jgi:hypothetical protein
MDVMVIFTIASIENILPFCLTHFRTVTLPVGEHAGVFNVTGMYVGDTVVGLVLVGLVVGSRVGLRDVGENVGVDVGLCVVGEELGLRVVGETDGLDVGLRDVGKKLGFTDVGADDGVDVGLRKVGNALGLSDVGADDGVTVGADDVGKDVVEGYNVVVGKVDGNEL